jgi:hypothetical protein
MKHSTLGLSKQAFDIQMKRPRGWEFLLFAQFLDEEINSVNFILTQDLSVKADHSTDFYLIKNIDDLERIFTEISKDMPVVKSFSNIFIEMAHDRNEAAFGPPGKPGNPALLQLLAKKVANLFCEMVIFVKRKELEKIEFQTFFQRNINPELDGQRILCHAIEAANTWYITNTKNYIKLISEHSGLLKSGVSNAISSGIKTTLPEIILFTGNEKFEEAMELATKLLRSEKNIKFSSNIQNKQISAVKTPNVERFTSLNQVVDWLVEKKEIEQSELRDILLPLDHFPGSFVDIINEQALDTTGEIALEEIGKKINVNQDILIIVTKNKNKVFQDLPSIDAT